MTVTRKSKLMATLSGLVFVSVAAVKPKPAEKNDYTNLKVLPRNISKKDLSRIMIDEFEDDLGVSCSFCHAENKETHKPDYASDEKPEKEIARMMMKMEMGINKKYFKIGHPMIGDSALVVTCVSCHHGKPHPDNTDSQ